MGIRGSFMDKVWRVEGREVRFRTLAFDGREENLPGFEVQGNTCATVMHALARFIAYTIEGHNLPEIKQGEGTCLGLIVMEVYLDGK